MARDDEEIIPSGDMLPRKAAPGMGPLLVEFIFGQLPSPGSRRTYLSVYREFFMWMDAHGLGFEDLRALHIAAYLEWLRQRPGRKNSEKSPGPARIRTHHSAIKSLLGWFEVKGLIDRNASASVRPPPNPYRGGGTTRALTRAELMLYFSSFSRGTLSDLRDRAISGTWYFTWMREEALVGLRVRDYFQDGLARYLRVREKGGQIDIHPVHPELREMLDEYLDAAGIPADDPGWLFRSSPGRSGRLSAMPLDSRSIRYMVAARGRSVGLAGLHPHVFRVTGYNDYLELGGEYVDGQIQLGHASGASSRIYDRTRRREAARQRVMQQLTLKERP